jgi:RimJ/RimL family protein N-acetyltransferase
MHADQPIVNVVGERVALGPVRRDLHALYHVWVNDLTHTRTLFGPNWVSTMPYTLENSMAFHDAWAASEHTACFTIYTVADWQPIGLVDLSKIDYRCRSAWFNIAIGPPDMRGHGYGTEATQLILDFGFTALGLINISLGVMSINPASIRAYEKAGFREFGRRRRCQAFGDMLVDVVYMEALADEFTSPVLLPVFTPDRPRV